MIPEQNGHPLVICLPDGTRAELIDGSRPPRYTVDSEERAIEIAIPDDLLATGWYWSGSFLCQPYAPGDTRGICIITTQAAPPGWDYTPSGRCRVPGPWPSIYQTARTFDERWRLYQEERAAKAEQPQKKPKRVKKQTMPVVPEPELAYEQVEFL